MKIRTFTYLTFIFLGLGLMGCSPKEQATTTAPTTAEAPMKISGEAFYRERMAVPPEAQVEILLEDVSLADAPAKIIGSKIIPNAGQPPYQFDIEYLPSAIIPSHRYNLRARLTVNGELLFVSDQASPVFAEGQENQTKLLMRRTASTTANNQTTDTSTSIPTSTLKNTYWKLILLMDSEVVVTENQREPHIILDKDNRVAGSDGCNRMMGSYTLAGDKLSFGQLAGTMMACINGGEQAKIFTDTLAKVAAYSLNGDQLELRDETDLVIARFKAVALQ